MLDQIFMKVIDMSRVASIIIVIVLIARIFLKRYPKYISYALWGVVLFRLLCPFSFEFAFSFVPNLEPVSDQYTLADNSASMSGADQNEETNPVIVYDTNGVPEVSDLQTAASSADIEGRDAQMYWWKICILWGKYVWLLGIGIMFLYSIISLIKIRKNVSVSLRLKDNIYITDGKISPFVMGILRPRIYLPDCLSEKEQEYIILHECYHIRRLDHVIKLLAFVALSIHWFNPLVWVAFIVSGKDMEMSCDEAVIRKMGESIRADYAQSLLSLATEHRAIRGIPLAFGEGDTKSRVKNLAKSKKTKRWVLAIVILAVAVLILCLVSNSKTVNENKTEKDDLGTEDLTETAVTIHLFTQEDMIVTPAINEYDFATAQDTGIVKKIQGMLPGIAEGTWYIVEINDIEYYYGKYDYDTSEKTIFFGYSIIGDQYSLANGITVGMKQEEILAKYPNMAVMDFEGNYLYEKVTGHQGWNSAAYPPGFETRFDYIMIADIDLGTYDTLPIYVGLLMKDDMVSAITFYYPTAG